MKTWQLVFFKQIEVHAGVQKWFEIFPERMPGFQSSFRWTTFRKITLQKTSKSPDVWSMMMIICRGPWLLRRRRVVRHEPRYFQWRIWYFGWWFLIFWRVYLVFSIVYLVFSMAYLYMGLCIWYFEGCICTRDGVFSIFIGVFVHGMVYLVFWRVYLYTRLCIWYFGWCIWVYRRA